MKYGCHDAAYIPQSLYYSHISSHYRTEVDDYQTAWGTVNSDIKQYRGQTTINSINVGLSFKINYDSNEKCIISNKKLIHIPTYLIS